MSAVASSTVAEEADRTAQRAEVPDAEHTPIYKAWFGEVWGFINAEGKRVHAPKYLWVSKCDKRRHIAQRTNKSWVLVDAAGETLLSKDAMQVQYLGDDLFLVIPDLEGAWEIFDLRGEFKLPAGYTFTSGQFSEGRIGIAKGELEGFADRKGNIVLEPKYELVGDYSEGLSCVGMRVESRDAIAFGYIDREGAIAIPPQFDVATNFNEGFAVVMNHKAFSLIDRDGKRAFKDHKLCFFEPFSEGLVPVADRDSELFGFLDTHGQYAVEPTFHSASSFSEALACVETKPGHFGYIDRKGKLVLELGKVSGATDFENGLAWVATGPILENVLTTDPEGRASGWVQGHYIDRSGRSIWTNENRQSPRWEKLRKKALDGLDR